MAATGISFYVSEGPQFSCMMSAHEIGEEEDLNIIPEDTVRVAQLLLQHYVQ
jgi:hypothetical protein